MFENSLSLKLLLQINEYYSEEIRNRASDRIISLDMEKAFDRVEHDYLFSIIEKLEFGQIMTKLIQLLYTNIHQKIETPWGYTKEIKINRGIR